MAPKRFTRGRRKENPERHGRSSGRQDRTPLSIWRERERERERKREKERVKDMERENEREIEREIERERERE